MKALVALGAGDSDFQTEGTVVQVRVGNTPVRFVLAELPEPELDLDRYRTHVHVRVRAFSLNYRDRALMTQATREGTPTVLGSEFAGVVQAVGADVQRVRPGQRVMAELAWPTNGIAGTVGGVPTNGASAEVLVLHEGKLFPIPEELTDAEAAGFALNAQTAWSMVRRAGLDEGDRAVVLAATSNTSLAAIQRLRLCGVRVTATTRRLTHADTLRAMGVERVVLADAGLAALHAEARTHGTFDAIIDPFADVHLPFALGALRFFGRYVTCGLTAQGAVDAPDGDIDVGSIIAALIVKNVQLVGNCLGQLADLDHAVRDVRMHGHRPVLDSVHVCSELGSFLERSLVAPDRLGKVIAVYE